MKTEIKLLTAAHQYVEKLRPDGQDPYPFFYGHAVRDAYIAGANSSPALTTADLENIATRIFNSANNHGTFGLTNVIKQILTETLTPKDSHQTDRVDRALLKEVAEWLDYLKRFLPTHGSFGCEGRDKHDHLTDRLKQAEIALGVKE